MTTLTVHGAALEASPPTSLRIAQYASKRLQGRTAWIVGLGMLTTASLVLVAMQVVLAKQRGEAARVQSAWLIAKEVENERANRTRRQAAIDTFMKEAAENDLLAAAWDERRFGIRQAAMSRKAANRLLGEIARSRGRIFAAEQFEISVKEPRDGLFGNPASPDAELVVSMRGSMLYRAKASSK